MNDLLLAPFAYGYMLKALWVSALIGGSCGLLSCFVTLKGWSLLGDALSHAVVPGVALAYLASLPYALGAFVFGALSVAAMGWIHRVTKLREDAIIGIVFTTFLALGLFLISVFPSGVSLQTIIFGDILGISDFDARQILLIVGLVLLVLALRWKDLMLFCFDPLQAAASGVSPRMCQAILLALLAGMCVAALQAVGAILVAATLVTPGATAYLLTDRFGKMLGLAGTIGAASGFAGAWLSFAGDIPTGGCIVLLQTALFLGVWIFAPKHGVLATRRKRMSTLEVP